MLKPITMLLGLLVLAGALPLRAADKSAKDSAPAAKPATQPATEPGTLAQEPSRLYVLKPNDVVVVKVYQEEDLATQARIARDGTLTLPLIGTVTIGSNTVERAIKVIQGLYAKDYLVNPQVTLSIFEYGKRRFTVLGQVTRPGTYEMPSDDKLTLPQAIAMAGGQTRIGNLHKVTVQRMEGDQNKIYHLDAEAMANDKKTTPFEILPDDVITVGEKWI